MSAVAWSERKKAGKFYSAIYFPFPVGRQELRSQCLGLIGWLFVYASNAAVISFKAIVD